MIEKAFVCTCTEELKEKAEALRSGKTIDKLMVDLNDISNSWVKVGIDQWWGVKVEGYISNWKAIDDLDESEIQVVDEEYEKYTKEYNTFVQADELIDALEKSLAMWQEAQKKFIEKT
jgi:hypothetical protein